MPNFVDCAVFRPVQSRAEKQTLLAALGIPANSFVVGCVAAVKKDHKRIDYLIREFALFCNGNVVQGNEESEHQGAKIAKGVTAEDGGARKFSILNPYPADAASSPQLPLRTLRLGVQTSPAFLLIAGANTAETAELIALAESLIPGRYKIVTDIGRAQMPDLYRAMDMFVLTSLFEMMPIALLEALATGLPCVVNKHPVLEWMIGSEAMRTVGGEENNVSREAAKGEEKINMDMQDMQDGELESSVSQLSCTSCTSMLNPSFLDGGMAIDMAEEGALAAVLVGLTPEWVDEHGHNARERAVKMFSKETVIRQYVDYYGEIMKDEV